MFPAVDPLADDAISRNAMYPMLVAAFSKSLAALFFLTPSTYTS